MLRFAVFENNQPAGQWPVARAHLVGPDDVAVRGEVTFKDGFIECRKRTSTTVGLSLMYDVETMGRLMLQTCLLPDREEPYVLSVELARHRIKMFIAKSEEWQMFELSAEHPAVKGWEDARKLFTEALISTSPARADALARRALGQAIEATEHLAMAHAEILLHRRFAQRAASSSTLGVRPWPGRDSAPLRDLIDREFDVLWLPLRWNELEVAEGKYAWDALDRWMEWGSKQKKPIVAGPLLDFSKASLPKWMYVWQHDFETARDLAYDHMERVVKRYASVVGIWSVAASINCNDNFQFTSDQMIGLVRMTALLIRQSRKNARVMLELEQPFGEHTAFSRESLGPHAFIDKLVQEGIRLDAVGVQVTMGRPDRGKSARDLMQISAMLDRFFLLELPVLLSATGVPDRVVNEEAGWWHERWSPELQGTWASRLFALAMSKPFVESIIWSELFDHESSEFPGCGLVTADGRVKVGMQRLLSVRKRLRKPLGSLRLPMKAAAIGQPD